MWGKGSRTVRVTEVGVAILLFQSHSDTATLSLPSLDLLPSSASCARPAPASPAEASPEQRTVGTAALWLPVTEGRTKVLLY